MFLHRRFRHGFVFINTTKGITKPTDLIGRRIGIKSFLVTAIHWMRGLLEKEYGVPYRSVEWVAELDEDVDFTPPPGLRLTRLPPDRSVEGMLAEGEIDAVIHPDLIEPFEAKDPRVGRLWPELQGGGNRLLRRTRIFPIMHVMGIRRDSWSAIPGFRSTCSMPSTGQDVGDEADENPRIVPLAWYQEAWEEQEQILGADPWEYGITEKNARHSRCWRGFPSSKACCRANFRSTNCFCRVFQGRKRGDEFRI